MLFTLGLIRCVAVNPEGTWVAIGYSSGIISVLDTRTGQLLASWKGHEGEVLQVCIYHSFKDIMNSWSDVQGTHSNTRIVSFTW